jgi:hypothetical protein
MTMDFLLKTAVDDVIFLATFFSAILVFDKALSRFKIGKRIRSLFVKEVEAKIDALAERFDEFEEREMKEYICNPNIPLGDRVTVGEIYLKKGYNGAMQVRIENLRDLYRRELMEEGDD